MKYKRAIETEILHAGEQHALAARFACTGSGAQVCSKGEPRALQDRLSIAGFHSPEQKRLSEKLAVLEQGESAVVTASGMAAISNTLVGTLRAGSHLLAQRCLYGTTYSLLVNHLSTLGIEVDFIDADCPESWIAKLKPTTRAIYLESLSNPLLEIPDFSAVVEFARQHGLITIIDNTFASPINFNPIELGFDLVINSCSKYINGHNDIIAGCVAGRADLLQPIIERVAYSGSSIDSYICSLLLRGIETMALRVRQQNENALTLARYLQMHPQIASVIYPGLANHPRHQRAQALFRGYGGVLSLELNADVADIERFLSGLQILQVAPSLGSVRSLISWPARMTHVELPAEERTAIGISDTLLRLSVGIESVDDMIQDIEQAFSYMKGGNMGTVHKFLGNSGGQYSWESERLFHYGARPDVSSGSTVQWLLGAAEKVAEVALRYFEIPPGGYSAPEHHPYEHCVFVLRGHGKVLIGEDEYQVGPNDVVYTALDEFHQFINISDEEPLGFLCAVTAHRSRANGDKVYAESDLFPEYAQG